MFATCYISCTVYGPNIINIHWNNGLYSANIFILLYYYSGCVGGNNLDDIDNQHVNFTPYTVKRVNIPREAETSQ